MRLFALSLLLFFSSCLLEAAPVKAGIDVFFKERWSSIVKKKRVGLVTNHTGIDRDYHSTFELFKEKTNLVAVFTPEHGFLGVNHAAEKIGHQKKGDIPMYSLHGDTRRPTEEMLKHVDILVFDIQEIGCRSYTYASTLFYVMEEAAKRKIPVIVLDRPNPMGGMIVDGPMLEEKWRSFLGYINVPYCHGMTMGELALFFNVEYNIKCILHVVPMVGWKRSMIFRETGLPWVPTSPYIPEPDTPFYYASTGILGSLGVVNIGIGYTLPFKVVGAPWIDAENFAKKLNNQKLPGVQFLPFHYKPFYGKFEGKECKGVRIVITDFKKYRPLSVQYMLIGMLKTLYPTAFDAKIQQISDLDKTLFSKVNGTEHVLQLVEKEKFIAWKLIGYDKEKRSEFLKKRQRYLLYE